jgi:hypothetical protein
MQGSATGLLRDKSELTARLEAAQAELAALRGGAGAGAASAKADEALVGSLRSAVADVSSQLELAKVIISCYYCPTPQYPAWLAD